MKKYSISLRRLALILVLALTPVSLFAQDLGTPSASRDATVFPSIDFYPSDDRSLGFFNTTLLAGEQSVFSVSLGNNGEIDFEAVTYAADAYSMRNGGFGVRSIDDEQTGATTWLDYSTEYFDANVGESITREFLVSVPQDTPPGEYVTAIAMQTAEPVNEDSGEGMFRINQLLRTVIGVRIEVPGELYAQIELGDPLYRVEGANPSIAVPVSNVGNSQVVPSGELRVLDGDGNLLLVSPVRMGPIYGGHETEIWLGLNQPLPVGDYEISVVLEDESLDVYAELPNTALTVTEADGKTEAEQPSITFTTASAEPMPAADNVQFLAVDATITNTTEEPIANAQLSLIATVDGEEVERFPVSQSLSVPPGETEVSTRYIPLTGWTSGEWEFELLLETVEGSGAAVVVDRVPIDSKVTVP